MYNFSVKSKIHDYSVNFITNVEDSFTVEIKESDFIIIDKKVYKKEDKKNISFATLDNLEGC